MPSQLSCTSRASSIMLHADIFNCFPKIHVREKTIEISRHSRVVPCMYEVCSKVVTKWLRNPRRRQFRARFPPFTLTFPHVSCSVSAVFLGIS